MIELIVLKRLLMALLLGAIIGYERQRAHKAAGLRTHMLVCVSTALVTIVAMYAFEEMGGANPESSARIISGILTGIGFIGGGAILRNESRVSGLTTAASLLTVATIGIAVGVGFTYAAIAVTLVSYIILTLFWRIESKIEGYESRDE
ncbi:MAG: MgtC/SapB family protein [Patescibacteria group bacterium]